MRSSAAARSTEDTEVVFWNSYYSIHLIHFVGRVAQSV